MRYIYSFLYIGALIFLIPVHFFKRLPHLRKRWLKEKLGYFPVTSATQRESIWIHAVSVGETLAAKGLVEHLRRIFPEKNLVLSTMTDTGQEIALKNFKLLLSHQFSSKTNSEGVMIIYMPFDLGFIVRRVLKRLNTILFVTMETEIWPNTFMECKNLGIPVIVANARISEDSYKGYKKIRFFMRPVFEAVNAFCCSSEVDAIRLRDLGVKEDTIHVTGNLKFDVPPSKDLDISVINPDGKRIVVAGSTHPQEEEIILKGLYNLIKDGTIFLILAPRHPQRFKDVEGLINDLGLRFIKRSELTGSVNVKQYELLLLDTIGELSSFYSVADITIIGGSFVPVGGHNLLEPAYWSKPIICGRYMYNFPLAEEFFRQEAAIVVAENDIGKIVLELCNSPERRIQMGELAREIYERNSGSLLRTLSIIERFLTADLRT